MSRTTIPAQIWTPGDPTPHTPRTSWVQTDSTQKTVTPCRLHSSWIIDRRSNDELVASRIPILPLPARNSSRSVCRS